MQMTDEQAPIPVGNVPPAQKSSGPVARLWSALLARALRLSPQEMRMGQRGFDIDDPAVITRLETIGASFMTGYNVAVASTDFAALSRTMAAHPAADAGFAYEGAGMALGLTDRLTPGRRFFDRLVQDPANRNEYITWVGLGWALARLHIDPVRALSRYTTMNKWMALDGYGFHQGFFGWRRTILECRREKSLDAAASRVFDQGLGRSVWFVCGAHPKKVTRAIEAFEEMRRRDLWTGVGLAATYAGGISAEGLTELRSSAGKHFSALASGVTYAAHTRRFAGNVVPHNVLACETMLRMSFDAVADVALEFFPGIGHGIDDYQKCRDAVQARYDA
jgi:enediyne biosynthesis protein E3